MKNEKITKLEEKSFDLGKKACEQNTHRSPIFDPEIKKMLSKNKIEKSDNTNIVIMKAWLKGWDTCNLNK